MEKKDLSIVNCIATALIAFFLTIPVHELIHALTYLAYGDRVEWYSATAVNNIIVIERTTLSPFSIIMISGGSASIVNAIIGIILVLVLLKVQMGPMMRLFLTQLMGMHLSCGIGYFMIGGFFGAGDWGHVFYELATTYPGLIVPLRIILSILGGFGIVAVFFILNHMSYYFIEDSNDKNEKLSVAFKLHLIVLLLSYPIGIITSLFSPAMLSGELNIGLSLLYNFMWVPFFWGFMFTGVMNVLPPKQSRFLYKLPPKPNYILLAIGIILILTDIIVFAPGLYFG